MTCIALAESRFLRRRYIKSSCVVVSWVVNGKDYVESNELHQSTKGEQIGIYQSKEKIILEKKKEQ